MGEFESKYNLVKEVEKTEENKWIYQYAIGFGSWVLDNKKKALCRYRKEHFTSLINQSIKLAKLSLKTGREKE